MADGGDSPSRNGVASQTSGSNSGAVSMSPTVKPSVATVTVVVFLRSARTLSRVEGALLAGGYATFLAVLEMAKLQGGGVALYLPDQFLAPPRP